MQLIEFHGAGGQFADDQHIGVRQLPSAAARKQQAGHVQLEYHEKFSDADAAME
jgi:hypothetical protein